MLREWIIVHQIGVQADNFRDAILKMDEGETLAITAQLRQVTPTVSGPVRLMEPRSTATGETVMVPKGTTPPLPPSELKK
jgi:hypothetical protein